MQCKVCNSKNNPEIQHKVHKCSDCDHIYVNYSDDGIMYHKKLYRAKGQDGTRGSGEVVDGKFTKVFHNRRIPICKKRIGYIKEYFDDCDSVLDIGAGGGTFLNMIKENFNVVEGTEVSDLCASNLTNDGYKVYHGAFTQMDIDKSYDLVTCWHVLEHIQDLKAFPEKVYKITNKYLVLEVPINRKLRNPDNNFDGHFHYFSEQSMRLLFKDYFDILYLGSGVQAPSMLVKMIKR